MNEDDELKEIEKEFGPQLRAVCQKVREGVEEMERLGCLLERFMDEMATHPAPPPSESTEPKMSNPPTMEERRAYLKWAASDDPEAVKRREAAECLGLPPSDPNGPPYLEVTKKLQKTIEKWKARHREEQ
jgi:hypothetical protein